MAPRPKSETTEDAPVAEPALGDDRDTAAVVPTSERRPVGDPEAHHHEGNFGPVNTPAGAHKHSGFEPEHVHLVPPPPPDNRVVVPTPVDDDAKDEKSSAEVTVTVDADCKVVFHDQLVALSRGQKVSGDLARYLLDTGADVSAVKG